MLKYCQHIENSILSSQLYGDGAEYTVNRPFVGQGPTMDHFIGSLQSSEQWLSPKGHNSFVKTEYSVINSLFSFKKNLKITRNLFFLCGEGVATFMYTGYSSQF